MIRRLRERRRPLSLDAYIHRATRGLPQAERVDAAAELRAHLLDRMAEHQAQGFSREEAEYLAVRGMGDPHPVNRRLLGHALTHRAGWGVLALLLLGGSGWWTYREWLPPREGVVRQGLNAEDTRFLFTQPQAPRGDYLAYTVTYPRRTTSVVLAFVSGDVREIRVMNIAATRGQREPRTPGSYRFQQRWLILPAASDHRDLPWFGHCDSTGLYFITPEIPSPLLLNRTVGGQQGGYVPYGACFDFQKKLAAQLPLATAPDWWKRPMKLNQWNLVFSGGASWEQKSRSLTVMVLPTERDVTPRRSSPEFTVHAGKIRLVGDTQDLPPLPALP